MKNPEAKDLLLARRTELIGNISEKEEQMESNTPDDDEDRPFERQEDELLAALSQSDSAEIARIDAALQRIAEGTYGICAECGEKIAPARLKAVPDAILCMNCASSH